MTYWIIHIVAIGLLAYLGSRYLVKEFPKTIYWIGLSLKLTAGVVLGFIFFDYYGSGDTIRIFEAAKSNGSAFQNEPRTLFFIKLIKPIIYLSGESYWIASIWLSFIGFLGCWYATEILSRFYTSIKYVIATCLLLIPTVVFWSAGLMKDTLTFAALAMAVTLVIKLYKESRLSILDMLLLTINVFLLFKLKHYLLITLVLFSSVLIATMLLKRIKGKWKWPLASVLFLVLISSTQFIHPYLTINRLSWTLYHNNQTFYKKGATQMDIVIEDESRISVLKEVPKALHAGFFRPSVLDQTPVWGWIHRIENFILTVLIFLSLMLWIKLKPKVDSPLLTAAIICILILAVALPLSSPNFGSLVRYKNAYLPYLFLICSILPYQFLTSKSTE